MMKKLCAQAKIQEDMINFQYAKRGQGFHFEEEEKKEEESPFNEYDDRSFGLNS